MITEYFVCYGTSAKELQENVHLAMQKGWQPFGGVAVSVNINWNTLTDREVHYLCQAVVKMAPDATPS
ncbi:MAG: DUF1737 domain-containing protein [Acidobacteriia bacterium]|nr:DUF1737 domain-containing protein [Terriglobia bacterium]